MKGKLAAALALLLIGVLAGTAFARRGIDNERAATQRAMAALRDSVAQALATADSARKLYAAEKARADSSEQVAVASKQDADRWRAAWDSLPRDVPGTLDSLKVAYLRMRVAGDSSAAACTRAIGDCHAALAAKDSALVAADSVMATTKVALVRQTQRAEFAEQEFRTVSDRLEKMKRDRPKRDFIVAGLTATAMLLLKVLIQ